LSAFEDLRQNNEAAKGLSVAVLTRKLGSEGSVKSWNAQVDQHFDDVWTEEENVQRDSRAKKKGAKNEKRKEKAEPAGEVGDGGDGGEEGDGDDSDDDDGNGSKKRNLRTCTANLQGLFRSDLADADRARVMELCKQGQEDMTRVIEDLSVLTRKAVRMVSAYEKKEGTLLHAIKLNNQATRGLHILIGRSQVASYMIFKEQRLTSASSFRRALSFGTSQSIPSSL